MKIVNLLQDNGFTIWMDESGIETGEQFKKVIVKAIEECKILLFFSSVDSNKSPWTAKEIGVANSKDKPILPIKLDKANYNEEVLFDLVNLDYCDLSTHSHRTEQIDSLLTTINKMLGTTSSVNIDTENNDNGIPYKLIVTLVAGLLCIIVSLFVYLRFSRVEDIDIIPQRGAILDEYGRKLAYSENLFDIYIDKRALHGINDKQLKDLSGHIAEASKYDKNAYQYYTLLTDSDDRYLLIAKGASDSLANEISHLPTFVELKQKRPLIFQASSNRIYPYGDLLTPILGTYPCDSNSLFGLEYNFNDILAGRIGKTYRSRKYSFGINKTTAAIHGSNVRTTINLEFQQLVDSLLQDQIDRNETLDAGHILIIDSESGAIRAIANYDNSDSDNWGHLFSSEMGNTFKTVSLAVLLEEQNIQLSDSVPTNHGFMNEYPPFGQDQYIRYYERMSQKSAITVLEGFKFSSNYIFRKLVLDLYKNKPTQFTDMLHQYKLDENINIGIEPEGVSSRVYIPNLDTGNSSIYALGSIAIGYSLSIPQINLIAFYNAIANNGYWVKPYLIESYESNDEIIKEEKPSASKRALISQATVDSLKYAMTVVNESGTGSKLKGTSIAGKTGTSQLRLNPTESGTTKDPYTSENGMRKYIGTYIGFFPVESPKYTIYASFRTKLTSSQILYGGSTAAEITKAIADSITEWNPSLNESH